MTLNLYGNARMSRGQIAALGTARKAGADYEQIMLGYWTSMKADVTI